MDYFKETYGDAKGRTDSMYVYVLYKCSQEKIREHIKKQLEIIERVNDAHKRRLFSSRYFLIRDMVELNPDDHEYDCVMFVGDDLTSHPLTQANKELLKRFDHQNITFVYDTHYRLDFVQDLLFNADPYHIYRVNNNHIDYIQITKTKKLVVQSRESKPLDIQGFVDQTLPVKTRYIMYGVSSKFKDLTDPRAYAVINKHFRDEELIDLTLRIDQEDILDSFANDLSMIHDPKQLHKVCFKKDIPGKIKNSQLEKLYIDSKMCDKFMENIKKNQLDMNFKLICIDTSVKSFIEGRERLIDIYCGVVGISYY
jgi:hypothetical protein